MTKGWLNNPSLERALEQVVDERHRQDLIWPEQENQHSPLEWLGILSEEYGEASKEANELHFRQGNIHQLREEVCQVAAVAVKWLEQLNRAIPLLPVKPSKMNLTQAQGIMGPFHCPVCGHQLQAGPQGKCKHQAEASATIAKERKVPK